MKKKYADGGMFREGMPVPQDIDGASAPMKRPMPKAPMKRPMPAKRPAGGMFREGMPVPQDIDGASAAPRMPGMKSGGSVGSASKRADGCATKGKTKGRMI